MKKIIKKMLITASCFALASVALMAGLSVGNTKAKAMVLEPETEILSTYELGTEFSVPKASIVYNGKDYDATALLYFPDGTLYNNDIYTLSSMGEYTLVYEAVVDGKTVSMQKAFKVYSNAYNVDVNTTLEYRDSLTRIQSESVAGLYVSLPEKSIFTYNEPINIYDYDSEKPLIRIHPYSDGGDDTYRESFRQIVRLTDCYDADNYVEFELNWDWANHITETAAAYYRASVSGGKSIGLPPIAADAISESSYWIGSQRYAINAERYGAFSGTYDLTDAGVTVYFDPIENIFYAEDTSKVLVSKVDSVELYGNEAFKGFTTGEVYISVCAEEYFTGTTNIEISLLAGYEQKELHMSTLIDAKKPNIVVDVNDMKKPYFIANNESVMLPKAKAYDINLVGDVSVAVYSNYGTDNCRQISCKNGVFTPKTEGLYTVVYTAKDAFGNVANEELKLSCSTMNNDRVVSFSVEELDGLTAGTVCKLPAHTVSSPNGEVEIQAYYSFGADGERTPIGKDGFLVENVGEYQIIYVYSDVLVSYEKKYTVTSVASDNVTFDTPIFPEYVIANAKYTFESVYAYTYEATNPTPRKANIYLIKDGDETTATEVDYDNVSIPTCSTVSFKYVYGEHSMYSQSLPVVDVGFGTELQMQNYFVGNFTKEARGNGVYYTSKTRSGSNTLEFINILSLSSFTFSCVMPQGYSNFTAVDVCLIDYYNRDNAVTISYINKMGNVLLACGVSQVATSATFAETVLKFYYNEVEGGFYDMSGKGVAWKNTFSSDKILLKVTLRDMTGISQIAITEVCGSVLSNDPADYFKPFLFYDNVGGIKKEGETITLSPAYAIDVLCPFVRSNLIFSVTTPSGKSAVSDDGITLKTGCDTDRAYNLTLTENGKYRIQYSYTDEWGNMVNISFFANVSDTVPPTIVLDDGYNEAKVIKAGLNEKVTLQKYTVSDDKTAVSDLLVKCMVYSPAYEHVFVKDGAFTATKKGIYTVYYYVYDSVGNYGVTYYSVIVE